MIGEGPDRTTYLTTPTAPLYEHWQVRGRSEIGEEVDVQLPLEARLRWIITCRNPRCAKRYLVTHTELLGLLVLQVAQGPGYIMLPASYELPESGPLPTQVR